MTAGDFSIGGLSALTERRYIYYSCCCCPPHRPMRRSRRSLQSKALRNTGCRIMDLESDRMVNSFVAKKDLDSEMTVVRNEYESGENSPVNVLEERVMSSAFLWHNYGKSTIGARSDIENVPIERLQAFYRNYYQPDNAILVVAGKFDEAKTLALIDKYFSPVPRPARTLQKIYTVEPVQDGEPAVTLRRVGDTQLVQAIYHVPSGAHPDFAAVDILAQV